MLKSSPLCLYSSNLGTVWVKIEQSWPIEEISIFSHGGHLGYRTALTDTIIKGDHTRIFSAKFGWEWPSSFREDFFNFIPPFSIFSLAAILVGSRDHRTQFWKEAIKDHSTKAWLQLPQWFLRRRCLCEFPIGSYVKLSSAVGAILIEGPNRRTHFWKRTIQWLFNHICSFWEEGIWIFSHRVQC